jgi:Tol biopolymer transport system component
MGPEGENAHKIYEIGGGASMAEVLWSPDGQRVAYVKRNQSGVSDSIETRDLKGGSPTEVFRASDEKPIHPRHGFIWLPDGRIVYFLVEPGDGTNNCSYWQVHVDPPTGRPREEATRVANWLPDCVGATSFTADGKHIAFVRWAGYSGIYVAGLAADNARITTPRRLTLDDTWNNLEGWTPDSKSVLLLSNRNKRWEVFRQAIDSDTAERIVAGRGASVTPDGSSVLYHVRLNELDENAGHRLLRIPIAGGTAQELATGLSFGGAQCARLPANVCVIAERSSDGKQRVFSLLDLQKGRGRELFKFDANPDGNYMWVLSPEGSRVAVLKPLDSTIHVFSLDGKQLHDISPAGRKIMTSLAWTRDGKGFFVSSREKNDWLLLHVDLQGVAQVLWQQEGSRGVFGMPSPDGRHLAIRVWLYSGNIWMADNF